MDKVELLKTMRDGRAEWEALMAQIPLDRLREAGVVGSWSVADVAAHLAAYEHWVAGNLAASLEGREATPQDLLGRDEIPEGVDELEEDDYNAWVVAEAADVPGPELLARSLAAHDALVAAVEACPEDVMHDPGRWEWLGSRSVEATIPGQCYGHYQEHAPDVRGWLAGSS